ncbi:FAD-dependent oxidoreductase [Shewanella surugensis]|uniref:FAD-dependent oxidoreductase n=1 Tax=Shewanella surugensis TaxID=212020 RepID=A0ABT0LJD6_9GAMM|nr:FAD-dependent oxidoreductase [Shewanella surugensis]MCL1127236.1 FAD-dependent oxidoreductase [Shewanella surugensis]
MFNPMTRCFIANDIHPFDIGITHYKLPDLGVSIYIGTELNNTIGYWKSALPSNGGMRLMHYETEELAEQDCYELTLQMCNKHHLYQTGFSGGKIVINTKNIEKLDKRKLLLALAQIINSYEGRLFTGCDVNININDMAYFNRLCPNALLGFTENINTNLATAYSILGAIKSALSKIKKNTHDISCIVHGCGNVGAPLANLLISKGMNLIINDSIPGKIARNVNNPHREILTDEWQTMPCDIFIPCTPGKEISVELARKLRCSVIVGATNIPFAEPEAKNIIDSKGILYIASFISSAGAVISDSIEHYSPSQCKKINQYAIFNFIQQLAFDKTSEYINRNQAINDRFIKKNNPDPQHLANSFKIWKQNKSKYVDYTIIGAGIAGTSAAYYLSKHLDSNQKIILLDQGGIANKLGSSAGSSRMYREMYSDPFYSKLMKESLVLWRDIEKTTNVKLITQHGLLFFGSKDTGETVEGSILGAEKTMKQLGIEFIKYDTHNAIEAQYPYLRLQPTDIAVYSPADGMIAATKSCQVLANLARQKGTNIIEGINVCDIENNNDLTSTISLSNGDILTTKKLIITTGAWTKDNIEKWFGISLALEIHSVTFGYYQVPKDEPNFPQWFCFRNHTQTNIFPECKGLYYGFPAEKSKDDTNNNSAVRVGIDFTPKNKCYRPEKMADFQYTPDSQIVQDINAFVANHFPQLEENLSMQCSPYSITADQDFVLGKLPGFNHVFLFCGGNGRAFKFGPKIGKLLADLAQDNPIDCDISRFSPTRLLAQSHTKQNLSMAHVPWGTSGSGIYTLATQGCFDVINKAQSVAIEATSNIIQRLKSATDNKKTAQLVIALCDYGSADSGISLYFWKKIIHIFLNDFVEAEIELTYEDQAYNDWKSVFYYTQGIINPPERFGNEVFLDEKTKEKVFIKASGTSFYCQCLPSNTLHFGFSSTAMHWLSKKPAPLPGHILHHTQLTTHTSTSDAFANQAAQDWEKILVMRAKELCSGGQLVIANFCISPEGWCLGNTPSVPNKIYDVMSQIWLGMCNEKLISKDELNNMSFMNYFRTPTEMLAPFFNKQSLCYQNELRYISHQIIITKCPYYQAWLESDKTHPIAHAKSFIPTLRTWSNSTFESALNETIRSKEERSQIVDVFYSRYEAIVASAPDDHAMDYVHCVLHLEKV